MPAYAPDLPVILAFAAAALVLTLTPGPDMALFLSRTISFGRRHGLAALFGALTGIVVHSLLAALGISVLIAAAPAAFMALKICGALYLLFLAFQALTAGTGLRLETAGNRAVPPIRRSYLSGLGINLLNPKIILFFVTFLPQFVSPEDPYAGAKLFFLGIEFIVVALPLTVGMVFAAHWLAGVLTRSRWIEKLLNWSFAAVFAAFAVTLLTTEARR